jgi:hypothetical protein
MKIRLLLFVCLMIGFVSCDYENDVYYLVENNTQDSVRLDYSYTSNCIHSDTPDTSIILSPNQKDTIFVFTLISPFVYDPEDGNHMMNVLFDNIIRLRDNVSLQKDMSLRKNWNYVETGKYSAVLECEIDDNDW